MKFKKYNSGQVWIETVIYTLIGLAIIGIMLAFVNPAIQKKKDQSLIDTSLSMMKYIENGVETVRYYGVGNSYPLEIKLVKGQLEINPQDDFIEFSMDSKYQYSELGENISDGKIIKVTNKKGSGYEVRLSLSYKDVLNITWGNGENDKILTSAPTPYEISVQNLGQPAGANYTQIDFFST